MRRALLALLVTGAVVAAGVLGVASVAAAGSYTTALTVVNHTGGEVKVALHAGDATMDYGDGSALADKDSVRDTDRARATADTYVSARVTYPDGEVAELIVVDYKVPTGLRHKARGDVAYWRVGPHNDDLDHAGVNTHKIRFLNSSDRDCTVTIGGHKVRFELERRDPNLWTVTLK